MPSSKLLSVPLIQRWKQFTNQTALPDPTSCVAADWMRILVASLPLEGHYPSPSLLGQCLAARGHEVVVWSSDRPSVQAKIRELAPDCAVHGYPHPFTPEEEARLWAKPRRTLKVAQQHSTRIFAEGHGIPLFKCLDLYVTQSRPDLIIADAVTWGAWDVAEKHKIPLVVLSALPISSAVCFLGAFQLWKGRKLPVEGMSLPWIVLPSHERMTPAQRLLLNPALKQIVRLSWNWWGEGVRRRVRRSLGLPPRSVFHGSNPNTQPPHMVLIPTVPALEEPMRLPSHWYVCGAFTRDFTQPPPPLPEGDEIRVWLEEAQAAGDHVVYIAMGTLAQLSEQQVLALATAFLALSDSPATLGFTLPPVVAGTSSSSSQGRPPGIRFLWSIKDTAAKFLPKGLPKDKILARPWVAQPSVLAHPAVSLFVTHAGMNSVMESLAVGKPMFTLPRVADQHINAQHVVNKGVGERVPASSMTWQSVVAGITQVLADPGYAQQAAAIGASIRAAPAVQEAADRVEAFARAAGISIQAQHS